MRFNNNFRKIIDCFWRKNCRDCPNHTSSVVFFKIVLAFFLTDTSLNDDFSKFVKTV